MSTYSTLQVAKILGIGTETLYRWMHEGKVPMPPIQSLAGMHVRLWSESDLEKAKQYKAQSYWGKGSKRKYKKRKKRSK
jgi:excisionase family DNA binding protein